MLDVKAAPHRTVHLLETVGVAQKRPQVISVHLDQGLKKRINPLKERSAHAGLSFAGPSRQHSAQ
jgi:hypothetical protein